MTTVVTGLLSGVSCAQSADKPWAFYPGHGVNAKTHIVLISGDEEYRSEEALPQLARILSCRHGFMCTVLFSQDPETGEIDPDNRTHLPGLETLTRADLMIIATRFRDLPDDQMRYIDLYLLSGKPVIGLRTATHAFNISDGSIYKGTHTWNSPMPGNEGGFGRQVLGETWIAHHGAHGSQSTLGVVADGSRTHPIARGLVGPDAAHIWGPTDVYEVRLPLVDDATPVVLGAVLDGMAPDSPVADSDKNRPMMPVAWTRESDLGGGVTRRVFTTTMGAATDLVADGTRMMLVNGVYWALGRGADIPEAGSDARIVGTYEPTDFGFGGFVRGVKPSDHETNCPPDPAPEEDNTDETEASDEDATP
ncbi:MAG: hypothetical protein ACF8Q5_09560 [Phycisphaerales bacterium JB040]